MPESIQQTSQSVLIAAGGTGGHVFPALAVAECLREQRVGVQWLGTSRGIEVRRVPESGFELHTVRVAGVRGKRLWAWIKAPFLVLNSVARVLKLIKEHRVSVVLGMGGYVSFAAGLAAIVARKPLILQEQNAVAGSSNKLLAPFSKRIFTGFEGVFADKGQTIWSGNPLRGQFSRAPKNEDHKHLDASIRVLIVGGSQGAQALNQVVPEAIAAINSTLTTGMQLAVLHQTGVADRGNVEEVYQCANIQADVVEFIEDIYDAYTNADLVIARSGALTVSELTAVGRPAIFVPYPHASDDHQTANARFMVEAGAALLIPQSELDASKLAEVLSHLFDSPAKLREMGKIAEDLGKRDAASVVASACCEYIDER